ncbi:MAG: RNA pseudouridine synthase [Treponema sp.]|nr:RNA pseudouridine synthase [Treponema sp.]
MTTKLFAAEDMMKPAVAGETSSFIVVYKPPCMHSAPLRENKGGSVDETQNGETQGDGIQSDGTQNDGTLLDFAAETWPEIRSVRGWKPVEGGLVHRLDYDTRGLLLIARTQAALDALRGQQEQNLIVKEYTAFSAGRGEALPGFPRPGLPSPDNLIESAFRPYGKGRKAVRPVLPRPGLPLYQTEIVSYAESGPGNHGSGPGRVFRLRLSRGYRHQIRCHLAWMGRPIVNDALYGGVADNAVSEGCLALCAAAISFTDPETGRRVCYGLRMGV